MYKNIEQPKYAWRVEPAPTKYVWRVELAPKVIWYREEGQQPNALHRMMQRLFFGFKWEKLDYEGSENGRLQG